METSQHHTKEDHKLGYFHNSQGKQWDKEQRQEQGEGRGSDIKTCREIELMVMTGKRKELGTNSRVLEWTAQQR